MDRIGTQTFGLKEEFSSDVTGTIQALSDIGFQAIEPFILFGEKQGNNPQNLWAIETLKAAFEKMNVLGITIPSAHIGVGFGWLSIPVKVVAKNIMMLQSTYGINDFVISGTFETISQAKHWAKLARKISDAVQPYGCRILYHNHDDEFRKVQYQGKSIAAMDAFLDLTSDRVMLQLDVGWAGIAADEKKILEQYASRIASIHLKDFYLPYRNNQYTRKNMPAEAFAPIGEGSIATKDILAMGKSLPNFTGCFIIDQDKSSGVAMLDALRTGYSNVQSMLGGDEV